MLTIRLARGGRKKYPVYRIVAAEKRRSATGKFVAVLGHYNPHTKDLVIKKDELKKFIENGAQPSNAVLKLMKQDKIALPKWAQIKTRDRKPKKEPEVNEEKTAEVATDVANSAEEKVADAPTEGTPAEAEKAEADAKKADEVADVAIETAQKEEK